MNLAAVLVDGQRIYLPSTLEAALTSDSKELALETSALININTASISELDSLPGIGEVKALAIFNYRQQNGLFTALEDLLNLQGISQSLFEDLKGLITLGE